MARNTTLALLLCSLGSLLVGAAGAWWFLRGPEPVERTDTSTTGSADTDASRRPAHRDLPGRWRPVTDRARGATGDGTETLGDLGYAGGYEPAAGNSGVLFHAPELAHSGLNLVHDGGSPSARLVDMDGRTLHEWRYELRDLIGKEEIERISSIFNRAPDKLGYFRRVHAFPSGDLLAIFADVAVVKLDRDSNLVWAWRGHPHHDLWVDDETGRVSVLTRKIGVLPRVSRERESAEDFVTILSPDGELEDEFSILRAFERSEYNVQAHWAPQGGDLQHTNTLEVLDGSLADRSPAFAAGNYLVSCRRTDTIAVIDAGSRIVVWALAGMFRQQHQPTVIDGGRMLLLDNLGHHGRSKVIEFDPFTQEVFWAYRDGETTPFFTRSCGSNQRLANGNTLITESDTGRAFEVDREGRIVWEFLTPSRAGADEEFIATLFEVIRLPEDYFGGWRFDE